MRISLSIGFSIPDLSVPYEPYPLPMTVSLPEDSDGGNQEGNDDPLPTYEEATRELPPSYSQINLV